MGTTQVLCQWLDPMTKIRYQALNNNKEFVFHPDLCRSTASSCLSTSTNQHFIFKEANSPSFIFDYHKNKWHVGLIISYLHPRLQNTLSNIYLSYPFERERQQKVVSSQSPSPHHPEKPYTRPHLYHFQAMAGNRQLLLLSHPVLQARLWHPSP